MFILFVHLTVLCSFLPKFISLEKNKKGLIPEEYLIHWTRVLARIINEGNSYSTQSPVCNPAPREMFEDSYYFPLPLHLIKLNFKEIVFLSLLGINAYFVTVKYNSLSLCLKKLKVRQLHRVWKGICVREVLSISNGLCCTEA